MSDYDDEKQRFADYLIALRQIHSEGTHYVKDILAMFNHFGLVEKEKKANSYHDLAEYMLIEEKFDIAIDAARKVLPTEIYRIFAKNIGLSGDGDVTILVKECMIPIPADVIFPSTATIADLRVFKNQIADDNARRYFIVQGEDNGELMGIVSINDLRNHLDDLAKQKDDMLVIKWRYFNSNPQVLPEDDTMLNVSAKLEKLEKSGKKITKLLIVDGNRRPVGLIGETQLLRAS